MKKKNWQLYCVTSSYIIVLSHWSAMKTFLPTKTSSIPPTPRGAGRKSKQTLLSRQADAFHLVIRSQNERNVDSISKVTIDADVGSILPSKRIEVASMEKKYGDNVSNGQVDLADQPGDIDVSEKKLTAATGSIQSSVGKQKERLILGSSSPMERFTREINEILNKIAPQNFEKLMNTLYQIKIVESCMLTKFIKLIFEKAISEQGFAYIYAEMCASLEARKPCWDFLDIVHNRDSNQYFWTKDLRFDESKLIGPFKSFTDCCELGNHDFASCNVNNFESSELQIEQIVLIGSTIMQVIISSLNLTNLRILYSM